MHEMIWVLMFPIRWHSPAGVSATGDAQEPWASCEIPCGIIAHTPPTLLPMCPACLSLSSALLLGELCRAVRGILASEGSLSQPLLVLPAGVQHREQVPFHSPLMGAAPPAQFQGDRREVSHVSAPSALPAAMAVPLKPWSKGRWW